MPDVIRIGTRSSELALWQANHIADMLRQAHPNTEVELVTFTTKGDKILDKSLPSIGGKGLFTEELEAALLSGDIDCAVHSLKDLPTENPDGLTIGAVPKRAPAGDVLVSKGKIKLNKLPDGATIGTSSLRRAAQIRAHRPDITIIDIRGNVPTRIRKALDPESDYDGIVLAQAGVKRLELDEHVAQIIPLNVMLPAPGQGAIGVQCRDTPEDIALFAPIADAQTWLAVHAERSFLNKLQGGCSVPVAAYAARNFQGFMLSSRVSSVDGETNISLQIKMRTGQNKHMTDADAFQHALDMFAEYGVKLAESAISRGADKILAEVREA